MITPFLLLAVIGILGLLLIYPITPRYFPNTKKFWITLGALLVHIGAYGLLWLSIHKVVVVSLFLVEGGLFVIWDPLKLCPDMYRILVRVVGDILLGLGLIISLSFFTKFPFWLWFIPLIGLILPYLIPPLQKYTKLILGVALVLTLIYVGVIGSRIYHFFSGSQETSISSVKNDLPSEQIETSPPSLSQPHSIPSSETPAAPFAPESQVSPLVPVVQEVDEKIKQLEADNKRLQEQTGNLQKENEALKKKLEDKENGLREQSEKIQEIKKMIDSLPSFR